MSFKLQRYNRDARRIQNRSAGKLPIPTTGSTHLAQPASAASAAAPSIDGDTQPPLVSESYATSHLKEMAQKFAAQINQQSSANTWGMITVLLIVLVWGAGIVIGFQTALAIQMSISILLAVLGLLSPSLGLLSIGLLCTLDAMAAEYLLTGGLLRFNTVNYWLVIVTALYLPFILRLRDLPTRALQLFLILIALEISFSSHISEGVQDVLNIGATFGLVVYFARALKDELSLYWLGVVNGTLAGMAGLVFFLQFSQLPYANPNNWSFMQLTALFSICIAFPYAQALRKSKLLLILLFVVNSAWIFLSGSRGGMLITALCVLYLFMSTRSLTWSTVMIAVAIAVGFWISTQFVEQQLYSISRIQLLFDTSVEESRRTSKRSNIAEAGWVLFKENPLGIGTGSFRREAPKTGLVGDDRPAHSGWIKTLAENGVPGILLLTAFIGSYALAGFKNHQAGKIGFGLFIAAVLALALVSKEFQGKALWFLAAAGIVLLNPKAILAQLNKKSKPHDIDYRQRLREVRFGSRR